MGFLLFGTLLAKGRTFSQIRTDSLRFGTPFAYSTDFHTFAQYLPTGTLFAMWSILLLFFVYIILFYEAIDLSSLSLRSASSSSALTSNRIAGSLVLSSS